MGKAQRFAPMNSSTGDWSKWNGWRPGPFRRCSGRCAYNYHVLHFVGHGVYDEDAQDGALALESRRP